jgi:hypothetical protein
MRTSTLVLALALMLVQAIPAAAEPYSADMHDIGELMSLADTHYDLTMQDAVLLLESLKVTLSPGTRTTTVHRIVWLGSEMGVDTYADLRVPYNTDTSELDVMTLRTWMDGRWWPHESDVSETAVVPTTPGALQSADDYTTIRETMLLHDGVEVPCIVETIYSITERVPDGQGSDGTWVIPGRDPAVLSILSVELTPGATLHHAEVNGAPQPKVTEAGSSDTYVWRAELTDRLPRPLTVDAEAYAPCVVWSTWSDWDALAKAVLSSTEDAMLLNETITDTVARLVATKPLPLSRAEAVVEFVDEMTRPVRYNDSFWHFAPRSATRTWDTAYGHWLDRAVLAAALFREVGCEAMLLYDGATLEGADGVPALSRFDGPMLWPKDAGALYDPLSGEMRLGRDRHVGRTVWIPSQDGEPHQIRAGSSRYELIVSLDSSEEGGWTGTGVLITGGPLTAYGDIAGIDGEAGDHLGRVTRTALEGATLDDHSLALLKDTEVVAGFTLSLEEPEADGSGRVRLEMGDPAGGIMARLPSGVHIYSEHRDSPVRLMGPMEQTFTLDIELGDREIVRLPEERSLTNTAGSFSLSVEQGTDKVTVTRTLALNPPALVDRVEKLIHVGPEVWPDLRALLLEESDHRNRVLLFE